jgi:hypothetical protein
MKIEFQKLNINWDADPVSSMPICWEENNNVSLDFFLNYQNNDNYKEGERARIVFQNCEKYTLNSCNDESFYFGQYRIKPTELEWGEFYELKNYNDRNFPNQVSLENDINEIRKHFILFFKDETFEVIAESFKIIFLQNSLKEYELLIIIYKIALKINSRTKLFYSGYESSESASNEIENYIKRIRKNDISVIEELKLRFAPTGKFQELSMENDWGNEFIEMSKIFDNYIK